VLNQPPRILVTGAQSAGFGTSASRLRIDSRLDYMHDPLLFGISTATLTVGVNRAQPERAGPKKIGWVSGVRRMV